LAAVGIEAVHWSTAGSATASDDETLAWARANACVLLTHDLDFSAILAATAEAAPSVIQLRMHDLLSDRALTAVVTAWQRTDSSWMQVHYCPLTRPGHVSESFR